MQNIYDFRRLSEKYLNCLTKMLNSIFLMSREFHINFYVTDLSIVTGAESVVFYKYCSTSIKIQSAPALSDSLVDP